MAQENYMLIVHIVIELIEIYSIVYIRNLFRGIWSYIEPKSLYGFI